MVHSATFLKSSYKLDQAPAADRPEYAFVGRSNVGKSSLINLLTNRRGLAKTSSTPGKTRLINHFLIDDTSYLVDLPGYGYTVGGTKQANQFADLLNDYLLNRPNLMCVFVLVDSRHDPMKQDTEVITAVGEAELPLALVFTKTDKLSKSQLQQRQSSYRKHLKHTWEELPPIFLTSAEAKEGADEILAFIHEANLLFDPEAIPS